MLLPLRYPRAWLALGWLLVVLAILASLLPGDSLPKVDASDKVQHAFAYAMLSIWFAGIYPRSRYLWIAVGLIVMGVGIEFVQGAMHAGRVREFGDVIANASGIVIGLLAAVIGLGGWAQRVERWVLKA